MFYTLKFIWLFSLFILISINLKAKPKTARLLKDELKIEKNEKKQFSLLIQIGNFYLNESPDSTIKYSEKALFISNKLNFNEGIARSYLLAGKAYNEKSQYKNAINKLQLSENIYRLLNNKTGLGRCYFEKSYAFARTSKSDSCTIYLDKLFEIFEPANNKLQLANIERIRGLNFWSIGKYGEGLISIDKAIKTYRQLNDSLNLSKALNTKGAILWGLRSYGRALDNFFESLNLKEALGDKNDQIIVTYNNIGFVYQDWNQEGLAFIYFKKAEKLIPESKNKLGVAYTYLNLGTYYLKQNEIPQALDLLNKAKYGYAEIGDINGVCLSKIRIAQCYTIQGELDLAKTTFLEVLKDAETSKNNHRIALVYYEFSKNEFSQNNIQQSLLYALKSLELANVGKYKDILNMVYEQLSTIYEELNETKLSLKMLQKALILKDEIYQEKIAVQSRIIELTHENEKKEFENKQLITQNSLKQKTIYFETFAVIMVLILLSVFSIYNYSLNKKRKALLAANEAKDKILTIISHDLRGPVGNLNNIIDLLVTEDVIEDYRDLLNMFKPVITSTYNMLENLLIWAKSNSGKLESRGKNISINLIINETVLLFLNIAAKKSISIEFKPLTEITVFADSIILQTIIRNLLNNAIKFTNKCGTINILVEESNKQVIISVKDNGVGISKMKQESIFAGNAHTFGTNSEKGSGLGLHFCKELADKNGGRLWVESTLGKGSTFSFSVLAAIGS